MKSVDLQSVALSKYQKGDTPSKIINHLNTSVGLRTIQRWCKMIKEKGAIDLYHSPGRPLLYFVCTRINKIISCIDIYIYINSLRRRERKRREHKRTTNSFKYKVGSRDIPRVCILIKLSDRLLSAIKTTTEKLDKKSVGKLCVFLVEKEKAIKKKQQI